MGIYYDVTVNIIKAIKLACRYRKKRLDGVGFVEAILLYVTNVQFHRKAYLIHQ
jgi:hypothetical protein